MVSMSMGFLPPRARHTLRQPHCGRASAHNAAASRPARANAIPPLRGTAPSAGILVLHRGKSSNVATFSTLMPAVSTSSTTASPPSSAAPPDRPRRATTEAPKRDANESRPGSALRFCAAPSNQHPKGNFPSFWPYASAENRSDLAASLRKSQPKHARSTRRPFHPLPRPPSAKPLSQRSGPSPSGPRLLDRIISSGSRPTRRRPRKCQTCQ